MKQSILTLFTRTPLHVGSGSSVGAIDQPVIRERHTRFPVIPGSGIKGVLADLWNDPANLKIRTEEARRLFGSEDAKEAKAGVLLIGEGRLLAFPVRAAKGCFAWLTCPLALNRFTRDSGKSFAIPSPGAEEVFADSKEPKVILEEYPLAVKGPVDASIIAALQAICSDDVWKDLPGKLAVVSDELFAYFVEHACEVAQHIKIDDETGVVAKGALFNQENVPSETLFYAVVQGREKDVLSTVQARLEANHNLLQVGADESTGLGWCSIKMNDVK
jgi:CRISPR-associated protein Cmr4